MAIHRCRLLCCSSASVELRELRSVMAAPYLFAGWLRVVWSPRLVLRPHLGWRSASRLVRRRSFLTAWRCMLTGLVGDSPLLVRTPSRHCLHLPLMPI